MKNIRYPKIDKKITKNYKKRKVKKKKKLHEIARNSIKMEINDRNVQESINLTRIDKH